MSPTLVAVAWRNLARNRQRTGLTVAAIALGLAVLIGLWGLSEGLERGMVRNFQDTIVGSFQVHHRGFFKRPELERHIGRPAAVVEALAAAGVTRWTWRLEGFALAAGPRGSSGVLVIGMDPEREGQVTSLPSKVTHGSFLTAEEGRSCVLGAGTAGSLGVVAGDTLVLMAYDRFGALAAEEFRVTGLIATGEMGIDRGLVLVPLTTLQAFLEMHDGVTSVVARVPEASLAQTVEAVRAALGVADYDVLRWHDMFPVLREWVQLSDGFHFIFLGIVLVIVLGGVLNTVLVSMLDRTRELGVLMALGMSTGQVRRLITLEALLLGALGTLGGAAIGIAVTAWLGHSGVDLSPLLGPAGRFYVDAVIRPELDPARVSLALALAVLTTGLAGAYPAWLASRLEPVEAMRRV